MARRGDTKPLCQRAQAGVAFIGMSLLPISDGKTLVLCQGAAHTFFGRCARAPLLWRRRQGGHFHHEGFVACGLPGQEECVAPIALGPWALHGIQDLHGTTRDLHNHDRMGCGRIAQEVTLHPDNRIVAALERFPQVIEAPVRVECHPRAGVDEAGVGRGEGNAEPGPPEEGADLPFGPHHLEPGEHHAHTGRHTRRGLLLGIPGQHPSMPQAAHP